MELEAERQKKVVGTQNNVIEDKEKVVTTQKAKID